MVQEPWIIDQESTYVHIPPNCFFLQNGWTALHEAAVKGNAEMVAYMMEQVNPNVDARNVRTTVHLVYMYML